MVNVIVNVIKTFFKIEKTNSMHHSFIIIVK